MGLLYAFSLLSIFFQLLLSSLKEFFSLLVLSLIFIFPKFVS